MMDFTEIGEVGSYEDSQQQIIKTIRTISKGEKEETKFIRNNSSCYSFTKGEVH